MSVYERIAAVMTDVTYLTRDCDMGEYWTLSDEKITSAVRASLIKNDLVIIPVAVETQTKDTLTATVTYRIQGLDDDWVTVCMSGSGESLGAALTNAHKYMLLQTFNIPNGMERITTGERPKSGRGNALLKALKKMCPDEQILNRISENTYGKSLAELTDDELAGVGKKIDELRGGGI